MARRSRRDRDAYAAGGAALLILGIWFVADLPGSANVEGPVGSFLATYWPWLLLIAGIVLLAQAYGALRR
jgi:hypothetical protein